eukprot:GSMAST32.ASY1.ANO1.779.1 assembled CDS
MAPINATVQGGKNASVATKSKSSHRKGKNSNPKRKSSNPKRKGKSRVLRSTVGNIELSDCPAMKLMDDFSTIELPSYVIANIKAMGYYRPTPIQRHSLPIALGGMNMMCRAQTGSGKTCAFLLPVIAAVYKKKSNQLTPSVVILAPTRELAIQIENETSKLYSIRSVVIYGGAKPRSQLLQLASGVDILVATPGRLDDFVTRGVISLKRVNILVLDEADRMLDMGFEKELRRVVEQRDMPTSNPNPNPIIYQTKNDYRQTLLYSATFPIAMQVRGMNAKGTNTVVCKNTPSIAVTAGTAESITQRVGCDRTIIFVNSKYEAKWVYSQVVQNRMAVEDKNTLPVVLLHGDLTQSQREISLSQFRKGNSRLLIATDVASRGLDIPGVSHVINFSLPRSIEIYVHRIGRTGRVGRSGLATSLYLCQKEIKNIKNIKKCTNEKSKKNIENNKTVWNIWKFL